MIKTSTPYFSRFNKYSKKMSDQNNYYKDVFGYLNRNEMKVSKQVVNNVIGFAKSIGVMQSKGIQEVEFNLN